MKFCTNCGAQVAEGSRFCTECGFKFAEQPAAPIINEVPAAPVYEAPAPVQAPVQQPIPEAAPVQEIPVQTEAPKAEAPKKEKKPLNKRLLIIAAVVIALLIGVFAMGGGGEDPNAGIYNCLGYSAMGMTLDGGDDYIELKSNGKATLVLMGEELTAKWTLEGTDFTLSAGGMDFYGVLENGVLDLNISDMIFTYERDPATAPAVSDEGSDEASEKSDGGLFCSHEWVEANCQSPKTCSLCGKTKGKAGDHLFSEATQQNPPTCYGCGMTNGEKLPAEMEVHGITEFMEVGQTYDYTTNTYKTSNMETVAKLTVKSYDIVESAEGYPAKEGYEWRIVEMEMVFSDWAARNYGFTTSYCREDYYNTKLHDDTVVYDEDADQFTHTVLYNNEEYEVILKTNSKVGNWVNHKCKFNRTFAVCVPVGYDGVVVGMMHEGVEYPEGGYIFDVYNTTDFCLFRCY